MGKFLVTSEKAGQIIETEAYLGVKDKAAHVYQGKKTPRNQIIYGPAGFVYIYLCYGLYWQLNITTGKRDEPECVLIRALGKTTEKTDGPGKLTRWLGLDKSFYGEDLTSSSKIWIEDRKAKINSTDIFSSPRIGIDYAQEWSRRKLRFYLRPESFSS